MPTSRTKAEMQTLLADNSTHAITPSVMRDLVESVFAPISSISGVGAGSSGKIPVFNSPTSIVNSQINDDGTHITLPDLTFGETDLGSVGAGPLDLDLSSYSTAIFKMSPPMGGTKIRSIKRKDAAGGQHLVLKNLGSSVKPGDSVIVLMQDEPTGVYQHIHLEGRQPWHVIPVLGACELFMDASQSKWFQKGSGAFQGGKYPIPILATIANAPINALNPPDDTTGLLGQYVGWWQLVPGASTVINGILAPIPAGSTWSRTLRITNYGASALPFAHNNGSGDSKILCPGGATFSLRQFATADFIFDEANHAWIVVAP